MTNSLSEHFRELWLKHFGSNLYFGEKCSRQNFYVHFFHDTEQRIDARNNNDHNTNRRWSQAVVIFCLYLNEHVATTSPRNTKHIKDFKSLGWHQCRPRYKNHEKSPKYVSGNFCNISKFFSKYFEKVLNISKIASSHKYYGKNTKNSLSSKMATQISTNFGKLCSCTAYNKTKQIHIKSALFTVPLSLQED